MRIAVAARDTAPLSWSRLAPNLICIAPRIAEGPIIDGGWWPVQIGELKLRGFMRKDLFKLIASGLNLNNEEFGFFYGSPKYDTQREFYHPTYSFGLNWTPARER